MNKTPFWMTIKDDTIILNVPITYQPTLTETYEAIITAIKHFKKHGDWIKIRGIAPQWLTTMIAISLTPLRKTIAIHDEKAGEYVVVVSYGHVVLGGRYPASPDP